LVVILAIEIVLLLGPLLVIELLIVVEIVLLRSLAAELLVEVLLRLLS